MPAVAFAGLRLERGRCSTPPFRAAGATWRLRARGQSDEFGAGHAGQALESGILRRRAVHHRLGEVEQVEVRARDAASTPMFWKSSGRHRAHVVGRRVGIARPDRDHLRLFGGLMPPEKMTIVVGVPPVIASIVPTAASTRVVRHCASAAVSFGLARPVSPSTASRTFVASVPGRMFSCPCGVEHADADRRARAPRAISRTASRTWPSRPGEIESSSIRMWMTRPFGPMALVA